MYGNQSGEFVCGYWGPSAWWPIEAGLLKFLAIVAQAKIIVTLDVLFIITTVILSSNNLSLESSDKNIKMA